MFNYYFRVKEFLLAFEKSEGCLHTSMCETLSVHGDTGVEKDP